MKIFAFFLFIILMVVGCEKSPKGGDILPSDNYYRAAVESSAAAAVKVFEFLPAPGQFVNERYSALTMQEACNYAIERFNADAYVSLGGFGGYLIVGFDHSIDNMGGYNIAIKGNAFDGNSEPGIVWVMKDDNGDGLPNDIWYELKGSEYGKDETIADYAVTYYKPTEPKQNVKWRDNKGNEGEIDYITFHQQDYYYPLWVNEDSYTLCGTCLMARNYDKSGNGTYWVNDNYDWGYADNYSLIDGGEYNLFKISNAVKKDGTPADLKYIDFVKVQVGVNAKSGWLGEISTEVFGIFDYNILKK